MIPDHYIVVLKDAATLDVHLATMSLFLAPKPSHRGLKNVFKIKDHAGYMVHVDENALEDIRKHPDVRISDL